MLLYTKYLPFSIAQNNINYLDYLNYLTKKAAAATLAAASRKAPAAADLWPVLRQCVRYAQS